MHSQANVSKTHFLALCDEYGFRSDKMKELLWDSFDSSAPDPVGVDDGLVSTVELIGKISLCTRGNIDDLTRFFFDIYDADDNGTLPPPHTNCRR